MVNHVYLGRIADIFKSQSDALKETDEKAALVYVNMAQILYDISRGTGVDVIDAIPADKTFLNNFELKKYSEFGQDGILEKIVSMIGLGTKTFKQIGKDNTKILAQKYEFVSKDTGDVDFMTIDVDGNDWYTWANTKNVNARVVMIAYNGEFEIDDDKVIAFDPKFTWDQKTDYFGATLKAVYNLGRSLGYSIVCCNNTGTHAFFIRDDCVPDGLYGVNNYRLLYRSMKTNPQTESGYWPHGEGEWTNSDVLLGGSFSFKTPLKM